MAVIEIKPDTRLDMEEVLYGVSKLDTPDLDAFVEKVLALRANRIVPGLSFKEAELLKKINKSLPHKTALRLQTLDEKRRSETLSETETEELISITEELEQLNIERVQNLGILAGIKGIPVRKLMKQLGIQPKPYA